MENNKKQELAKLLYIRNCATQAEIEGLLDVATQDLARWAQAGDWEALRKSLLNTRAGQLNSAYEQLSNLNDLIRDGDGYPSEKQAMTQKRLASTIQHLEMDASIGNTVTVAKELCDWLSPDDIEFAKQITTYFDAFIRHKHSRI